MPERGTGFRRNCVPSWYIFAEKVGHRACTLPPDTISGMGMHGILVILFAVAFGFTASGITANLYRLVASKPESIHARIVYAGVMILAGPSVLVGNAAKSFRAKKCSGIAFWLAAAVAGYWSFALGLFVLNIYLVR